MLSELSPPLHRDILHHLYLGFVREARGQPPERFGLRVPGAGCRVSGSGLGFRAGGARAPPRALRLSGFGCRVLGFGFWPRLSGSHSCQGVRPRHRRGR